jgi:hypothetical protein
VHLRCFRYRASLKLSDAKSLLDAEFRDENGHPDLEVSVFDIAEDQCCEVMLKRHAAIGNDPPRYACGVDLSSLGRDVYPEPEQFPFQVLNTTHGVLRFKDEADLLAFVTKVVDALAGNTLPIVDRSKQQLRAYLGSSVDDPEWKSFLDEPDSEDWVKYSGRPPSPPEP